ncbi:MAG: pectin acetylesterase-family hydrolase [Anaerolineae bacterium]
MTKRRIKLILAILGGAAVVGVLLLVAGYYLLTRTINVRDYATFADLPLYSWARVDLSDQTQCSDGSDYRIYTRRGESDNLIVHFVGGGACWDSDTCSKPISLPQLNGFYFSYIWDIFRATLDGIFQTSSADNPFHDWTSVYIPYCTADFHTGTTTQTYPLDNGGSVTVAYNGRQNVTEALDWVFATFDDPGTLLISGESAGAFGSTFWAPYIARHYAASDVYHLADGSYLQSDQWATIVDQRWKADFPTNFGYTPVGDLTGDAYLSYSQNPPPNVTFLQVNTLYDGVLTYFEAALNGSDDAAAFREQWSQGMRTSTLASAASDLDYFYFVTDYGMDAETGMTPHTSITARLFNTIEEDGVLMRDWLARIVKGGERFSVGEDLLTD